MTATTRKTLIVGVALVLLVLLAWRALKPADASYRAEFVHASGIKTGDEVRVAGIESGKVSKITLDGGKAVIDFKLDRDVTLHADSEARVKLASMLGTTFLDVSIGKGPKLNHGATITTEHTAPSYTVSDVFTDSNDLLHDLDLDAIDKAVATLSTELDQDPKLTQRAMEDTAALARLIGDKDKQIGRLLTYTRRVTGVVRDQQGELEQLLVNAEKVTGLVQRRRETIERLVRNGKQVVTTLDTMADDNDATMRTLLNQFDDTLGVLQEHSDELGQTLRTSAPFARYFANATGNGPWLEVGAPYFLLPDNMWCPLVQPEGGCS
ncbi:phospholipid/cholesterol/gamma-HCH transport system substrate-binding protein [Aeromicrobium panaciterrae]|uniref:Phospholipid/cholesterol/gamma-HCH transport system substrate-binding protein n=1 Tax=Aeromicrobium panaciterrae TaxID=363861 RepID=A0ABU1URI6_9ACTN|nr:MCE family protein [Aeromicrobium panaciterrae]MDR7087788.1 phospholipid/cholesterol/gamma-HCH transport system substrate-binding protein [Aeromicrobium panaciterrae]